VFPDERGIPTCRKPGGELSGIFAVRSRSA
jgi:hypothetical protein